MSEREMVDSTDAFATPVALPPIEGWPSATCERRTTTRP